jgi:hypothetical protein
MNFEEESRKALKKTFEWYLEYKRPGAGTISERLPADSVEEVFTKSGFNPSEDHDFRARKVWVIEYHNHTKNFILEGEWINYAPPPSA